MSSESTNPPASDATASSSVSSVFDHEELTTRVLGVIQKLVKSRRQRVLAAVGYGDVGQDLDLFWRELRYEVDRRASQFTAVQWVPLQFPQLRERLYGNLEYELETQLVPRPGEVMQQVLERVAPLPSEASQRILWLDWGAFVVPPTDRRSLNQHELQIWLQFCSDFLTAHCPRGVHIVSYLALETADSDALREFLTAQKKESWCKRAEFRLEMLPLHSEKESTE